MSAYTAYKTKNLQALKKKCLQKEQELAALDNLISSLQQKLCTIVNENKSSSEKLDALNGVLAALEAEEKKQRIDKH